MKPIMSICTAPHFRSPTIPIKNPILLPPPTRNRRIFRNETSWSVTTVRNGQFKKMECGAAEGCVPEKRGEGEFEVEDAEEGVIGMKELNEKCKELNGMAELLECLEKEAIMGEDEGREADDYRRRARIFYQSSKVFQAIKESRSASAPPPRD